MTRPMLLPVVLIPNPSRPSDGIRTAVFVPSSEPVPPTVLRNPLRNPVLGEEDVWVLCLEASDDLPAYVRQFA